MQRSVTGVFEAALALPDEQRASLAAKLYESLDGDADPDSDTQWSEEIERRLSRIESGQSRAVPLDDALARLHRIVRGE